MTKLQRNFRKPRELFLKDHLQNYNNVWKLGSKVARNAWWLNFCTLYVLMLNLFLITNEIVLNKAVFTQIYS